MNYSDLIEKKLKIKEKVFNENYTKQLEEINQNEERKTQNVSLNDKFEFCNLIDRISDLVYSRTEASYNQIQIKTIQNIAYLFAYGGFNKVINNAFYVYDLSPTSMGKSSLVSHLRTLLLRPAIKEVEAKQKEEKELAKEEKRNIRGFKSIHTDAISPEALYMYFMQIPVQMIEMGEMGKQIKQDHKILLFIIDAYGKRVMNIPSYKNLLDEANKHYIENALLFVYGDTNLEYLGIKNFYEHLKGGLLNRGLIAFSKNFREFENTPKIYELQLGEINEFNLIARDMIDFSRKNDYRPIRDDYIDNPLYMAFKKDIYNQKVELMEYKNPFANLYVRVIQNFNSVMFTLHLLDCYKLGYFSDKINSLVVEQSVEFMKNFISNYDELIEEVLSYKETQNELMERKVINKIRELLAFKNECTLREIYKPLKLKKDIVEAMIKEYIRENGDFKIHKKGKQLIITSL